MLRRKPARVELSSEDIVEYALAVSENRITSAAPKKLTVAERIEILAQIDLASSRKRALDERGYINLQFLDEIGYAFDGGQPDVDLVTLGARTLLEFAQSAFDLLGSLTIERYKLLFAASFPALGEQTMCDLFLSLQRTPYLMIGELCAVIDRALGNLYFSSLGGRVPVQAPGMRDILLDPTVRRVIGDEQIFLLRCVTALPAGLNLRNLYWHGLATPSEITPLHSALLLAVLLTVLENAPFLETPAVRVPTDLLQYHPTLTSVASVLDAGHSPLFTPCMYIFDDRLGLFEQVSNLFHQGLFYDAISLLHPQFEHCLRVLFVTQNDLPPVLATARITDPYLTLDCMLDVSVEGRPNALFQLLGPGCIDLLCDLHIHNEGIRMRDRVSHGEWHRGQVSQELCATAIVAALAVCDIVERKLGRDSVVTEAMACGEFAENYRSQYHPRSLLASELSLALQRLEKALSVPGHADASPLPSTSDGAISVNASVSVSTSVVAEQLRLDRAQTAMPFIRSGTLRASTEKMFPGVELNFLFPMSDNNPLCWVSGVVADENADVQSAIAAVRRTVGQLSQMLQWVMDRHEQLTELTRTRQARSAQRKNHQALLECVELICADAAILLNICTGFLCAPVSVVSAAPATSTKKAKPFKIICGYSEVLVRAVETAAERLCSTAVDNAWSKMHTCISPVLEMLKSD